MFYTKYTKLTEKQIRQGLAGLAVPNHVVPLCGDLVGRGISIKLDAGPALRFDLNGPDSLTLEEDGTRFTCAYGALRLGRMLLLSCLLPGELRGYHVIMDEKTGLVTVFRSLFCGYDDLREVQRNIFYGQAEGYEPRSERHGLTSRLQGKGFWWKDDEGTELLVFTPSLIYSTFVELTAPQGGLTISAPSDYIRVDDEYFIYSRVEAEYSGIITLELINVASLRKIGLQLGFDEADQAIYRLYTAEGAFTGMSATFSPLTDYVGDRNVADNGFDIYAGASNRPVYRPSRLHEELTKEQVRALVDKGVTIFAGDTMMSGSNNMPYTDYLSGKRFSLAFDDGPAWDYEVLNGKSLRWRVTGTDAWQEEIYRAYEPAKDLIFFTHIHTGSDPLRCVSIAADFSNGLATLVDSQIGNKRSEREVGNKVLFGVLYRDGHTPPETKRHSFTTELVGKSIAWTYSPDMSSVHVYSSPWSYSWTIFQDNFDGGMTWSSPCFYVKLREDAFLFGWVEETCGGNQCLVVFNPRIMHDGGFFFGLFGDGVSVSSLGAYATPAGSFDILKYFDNRRV